MLKQKQLLGKFRIEGILVVETGLHIGGGEGKMDIGGLDKPVARDPITQYPYLPGSSLKGKLRSLLERFHNRPLNRAGSRDTFRYESDDLVDGYTELDGHTIKYTGARTCPISRLFGSTGGSNFWVKTTDAVAENLDRVKQNDEYVTKDFSGVEYSKILRGRNSPAKIIVRDCRLCEDSAKKLERVDTGLYMTEWKWENGLDRVTAAANPRQIERVPAGAEFEFELVYTVEAEGSQTEQEAFIEAAEDLRNIAIALSLLEDDALGGHGSRGYGKVKFKNYKCFWRDVKQYRKVVEDGVEFKEPIITAEDTLNILKKFGNLSDEMQKSLPGAS
ncbi:type III-A CRISPR-associated RAMP protein Csm3 [Sphaerospermopsis aphanizomenoides BCCUSP55]|uniref:type III-A CRISPR-associated RAMP protein Csm3 n=1 Tax=Sphaerospermopsis aphanizomenoides TaxID=459663 RepID=UPI001905D6A0|nr:type III-A CRISPR-associated RAMP protein Csm3 [Sphaerospermopsis aphanizomenoides]MBK1986910.1 type III-A CRISPR-associated RAMP protein Csm3 [Sphaerospermopsis aphanizomenoides BCCUSP55]